MGLLLVFIVNVAVGQAIAIFLGLTVERYHSPYAGLVTFIVLYFAVFWVAWQLAIRMTAPGSRLGARLGNG
jgi:hypothetical protein